MKYYLLSVVLFTAIHLNAQTINGSVTNIFGEALEGATIYWVKAELGTSTAPDGSYVIDRSTVEQDSLIFSYVGFKDEKIYPGTLDHWEIQLLEDNNLAQIDITAKKQATSYVDGPYKVEGIGVREIERAACCSLAGCFSTNASVQSVTTNIVADTKELQILGLSGVYNQVLVDGVPLIQGMSLPLGSGSYPGTQLDQIFVSKGAGSVLQGPQGISGQINIITKKADDNPRLFLNAFANSFGESQYNANIIIKKPRWNHLLSIHNTQPAGIRDINDDGFRDIPANERFSILNKFSFNQNQDAKFKSEISFRYWTEKRTGGHIDFDPNQAFSGTNYGQIINVDHIDATVKMNYSLGDNSAITLTQSGFYQEQDNIYGLRSYEGTQLNLNTNLFADYFFGENDHNLKVGISNIHNDIDQLLTTKIPGEAFDLLDHYDHFDNIYGAFAETIWNQDIFTIILGLRTDHFGEFGWKTSPRMLIRAEVNESTDIRFSIGKGYRKAYPLAERGQLLSNNRRLIIDPQLAPEEAINIGVNAVYKHTFSFANMTLAADAYHTLFQNQIFPNYERSATKIYLYNFYGNSVSNSFQIENKWEFNNNIDFKWAYNYLDVYLIQAQEKIDLPFTTNHKWLANASWSTDRDDWQIDLTYSYTGSKILPSMSDFPEELQRDSHAPSFNILNTQLTKRWENIEVYGGAENIFNFFQEDPIVSANDPFGTYFDTSFTWGPTKGREFYLGLRYSME